MKKEKSVRKQQRTVLLVDNNPVNITALADALGGSYRILVATNGLDALQVAMEKRPDLFLL